MSVCERKYSYGQVTCVLGAKNFFVACWRQNKVELFSQLRWRYGAGPDWLPPEPAPPDWCSVPASPPSLSRRRPPDASVPGSRTQAAPDDAPRRTGGALSPDSSAVIGENEPLSVGRSVGAAAAWDLSSAGKRTRLWLWLCPERG